MFLYLLIFLIFLGFLINNLSKKFILSNITYNREISKKVIEIGEEFYMTSIVENKKALPITFLQIIETLPSTLDYRFKTNSVMGKDFLYHTMTFFLLPFQRIKRKYRASCKKRGRYIFGDVILLGGDFLGLKVVEKTINFFQEIIVLPKKIDIQKELIPYGDYYGDKSIRRWIIEDPTMIIGVKEYTGREPAKNIHWLSTLKHGELMVKNFDFTYENNVMIILNVECTRPYWKKIDETAIETCISVARGIGELYSERKIPFGFVSNSFIYGFPREENILYPSFNEKHLQNFLEYLGRLSYNVSSPLENILQKFLGKESYISTFVIITPMVLREHIPYIDALNNELTKVILISYYPENLDLTSEKILKYTIVGEKNGTFVS